MKKNLFISFCTLLFMSSCSTTEIPIETVAPITTIVKYSTEIKTIIDANCISCHANGESASFLPLTSYAQVKTSAESGLLISRMNNAASPMPPSGLLPSQTRATIDKWKADGLLEN